MCNVFSGSGMKVKILTYASFGLPIIATSRGAAGYEDIPSLIITDGSKRDIIKKISMLLKEPHKAAQIGKENRSYVQKHLLWNNITNAMKYAYDMAYASFHSKKVYLKSFKPFWLEENRVNKLTCRKHIIVNDK
jgi:glycosyltransferase involved in cell wall biosynthesis